MYKPGQHVYLAAAFFNDKQAELCSWIESQDIVMPVYSPRKDGGILRPDSNDRERKRIFESNTQAIEMAAWVLAVVDDFDAGVMWEMGYAWAKRIPTLGYSDVEGRGLNVMLAGSCELGFVTGRQALRPILMKDKEFPANTWRGTIQ